jgi:hypothetical protein
MKHIKLFEGFYSDRIREVENELRIHMKNDLANWINEFKDEFDDVEFGIPYIDKTNLTTYLVIDFIKKASPTKEDLEFIEKTYNSMVSALKSDYKIYITYNSKENRYDDLDLDFRKINKLVGNILRIEILFQGK